MANANTWTPLRRSMNASRINSSAIEMTNDEEERAERRRQVQMQKRLATTSSSKADDLNASFTKEHQLFTENKITAKNVWKLKIIDNLKPLCEESREDVMQIAIDISAKVYGIRVDDLHAKGLKLANKMARLTETATTLSENDDGTNSEGELETVTNSKKKKRKRPNQSGVKSTINRNPKGNLGKLPKLEPADVTTTSVKSGTGTAVDNLFTSILKETPNSFILLDETRKFIEKVDPTLQNKEKISLRNIRLPQKLGSINPTFNDFAVDKWDPEQEEKQSNVEKSLLSQIQPFVFDDNGFPIPQLDGPIDDIFENNDADVDMDDDKQITEVQQRNLMLSEIRTGVASVVDSRPMESTIVSSEYSFNPVIKASNGKYLDQIWAGLSHLKLKSIRRSTPRFSGQGTTTKIPQKRLRKKSQAQIIDFDSDPTEVDMSKTLIIRKKPRSVDIDKITLPLMDESCARIMVNIKELMLKPGVVPVEKKDKPATDVQEDFESQSQNHTMRTMNRPVRTV